MSLWNVGQKYLVSMDLAELSITVFNYNHFDRLKSKFTLVPF